MAFSPITTAADTISKLYGAAAQQRRADTPIKPPMATAPMLPQPTPAPVDPLQQKFNDYMLGKPMTPGRGKRRGQSVVRGGRYSGRTPDELYGVLAKEQNRGSGLSTGSLSQGSGIDWLKANRTSGATLAAQEGNVARRGDRYDTRAGYQPPTTPMKPTPMQPVSPVVAGVGSAVPAMEKPYTQWARDYGKTPQTAALNASPAFMNEAAPKPVAQLTLPPIVPPQQAMAANTKKPRQEPYGESPWRKLYQ